MIVVMTLKAWQWRFYPFNCKEYKTAKYNVEQNLPEFFNCLETERMPFNFVTLPV
jgi:hypothetical protein